MPAQTVELLDARIKGKKKIAGKWHPDKPAIMFYPDTTYRLHPACYDPSRFDLVKPSETPPAPASPTLTNTPEDTATPRPLSRPLGGEDAAVSRPPVPVVTTTPEPETAPTDDTPDAEVAPEAQDEGAVDTEEPDVEDDAEQPPATPDTPTASRKGKRKGRKNDTKDGDA